MSVHFYKCLSVSVWPDLLTSSFFSRSSIDSHRTEPMVPIVFWMVVDHRSCCFTGLVILSQISGLSHWVMRVSQWIFHHPILKLGQGYFFGLLAVNKGGKLLSIAGPVSSALRKFSVISNNNEPLLTGCSIQARFSLGMPSAVLWQKSLMSLSVLSIAFWSTQSIHRTGLAGWIIISSVAGFRAKTF